MTTPFLANFDNFEGFRAITLAKFVRTKQNVAWGLGLGSDRISMSVAMCDVMRQICDVIISEKMADFRDFRPTFRGFNS